MSLGSNSLKCPVFEMVFRSKAVRNRHLLTAHNHTVPRILNDRKCPECDREFTRKYDRDRHLKNVHNLFIPRNPRGRPRKLPPTVIDGETPKHRRNTKDEDASSFEVHPTPESTRVYRRLRVGSPFPKRKEVEAKRKAALQQLLAERRRKHVQKAPKPTAALDRAINQLPQLKLISKARESVRRRMINYARRDLIVVLCDCAHNCLRGSVSLTAPQKRHLARYKHELRTLARKDKPLAKKRKLLQRGGLLGTLLKIAIPLLTGLIGHR